MTYDTPYGHVRTNVIQIGECWVYDFDNFSQCMGEVILRNSPDVGLVSKPKEKRGQELLRPLPFLQK